MKRHTQVNNLAVLIIIAIIITFGFLSRINSIRHTFITNLAGVQLLKLVINDTPHSLAFQTAVRSKIPLNYSNPLTKLQQKIIREERDTPEEYLVLGLFQVASGNWENAEKFLTLSDQLHQGNQVVRYWLGYAYFKQNKIEEALDILASVNALGSIAAIGDEFYKAGLIKESSSFYELAIRVGLESERRGDSTRIATNTGFANLISARNTKNIRKIIGIAYNQLGEIALAQNMVAQALTNYEEALTYYPENLGYRYNLAQIYLREGEYGKAIEHMIIVNDREPGSAVWLGALGEAYLMQGDITSAENTLLLALKSGNERNGLDKYWHARSYYALGTIYCQRSDWEHCIKAFAIAVQLYEGIDPSWEYVLNKNLRAALDSNSEDLNIYLQVGDIYSTGGKYENAHNTYREADLLWPENPEIKERIYSITNTLIDRPVETP